MPNLQVFSGRVAAAPVLTHPNGKSVCKFTLIRNEYAGQDNPERIVSVPFVVFGERGEAIGKHVREGDQIIVEARIENNNYQDGKGQDVYGFNFVVQDFEFGAPGKAKREELNNRNK